MCSAFFVLHHTILVPSPSPQAHHHVLTMSTRKFSVFASVASSFHKIPPPTSHSKPHAFKYLLSFRGQQINLFHIHLSISPPLPPLLPKSVTSTPQMTTVAPPDPGSKRTALEVAKGNGSQQGKVFLITGAYSGIGAETVRALLSVGGRVIVGGRNEQQLDQFIKRMQHEFSGNCACKIEGWRLDLADAESVKRYAETVKNKYEQIDVLVLNAGVMNTPPGVTKNGWEMQFGINAVGHFLLAKLLAPITKRQVWVSSDAHLMNNAARMDLDAIQNFDPNRSVYDGWAAYQQSKLANIMLAKEFARRYPHMLTAALHPGIVRTNLARYMNPLQLIPLLFIVWWNGLKLKTPQQGAATSVWLATATEKEIVNGAYYADCVIKEPAPSADTLQDNKALFEYCDQITASFL